MRAWLVLVLVACDGGDVTCAVAAYADTCGGQTATICVQSRGDEHLGSYIAWTNKRGDLIEQWECTMPGCGDVPPNEIVCRCGELEGWGTESTTYGGAGTMTALGCE